LAVASLHSDLLDRNRKLSQNRLDFVPFLKRMAAFKQGQDRDLPERAQRLVI
jgi:hypothetical protein